MDLSSHLQHLFKENLDAHIQHVHKITKAPLAEIRLDLLHTKSLDRTLERWFNGDWLLGVPKPRNDDDRPKPKPATKLKRKEVVILDIEDTDNDEVEPAPAPVCSSPVVSPLRKRRKSTPIFTPTPPRPRRPDPIESDPITFTSPLAPETRERLKPPSPAKPQMKPKTIQHAVINLMSSSDVEGDPVVSKRTTTSTSTNTDERPVPTFSKARKTASTSASATISSKTFTSKPRGTTKTTAAPCFRETGDIAQKMSAGTRALLLGPDSDSSSNDETALQNLKPRKSPTKPSSIKKKRTSTSRLASLSPSPPLQPKKRTTRLTSEERTQRVAEKATKAAEKAAEKALKDAEKASAKALKDANKASAAASKASEQLLNSVNKLRSSKKDCAPEMQVCLSPALQSSAFNTQVTALLTTMGSTVDTTSFAPPPSAGRILVWNRHSKATYDPATGLFAPRPNPVVVREAHLLLHLTAKEYFEFVASNRVTELIDILHKLHPPCAAPRHLILLLEGYTIYLRTLRNAENRRFRAQVREENVPVTRSTPSEQVLETSLLTLQTAHKLLIHHTSCASESAEWIALLTGDLATAPYKRAKAWLYKDTAFCAETRAGTGARDTFVKMLLEVARVTPAIAEAVVSETGSVGRLVEMLEKDAEALSDVEIGRVVGNKKVGKALSRRLRAIFCGGDETAMDGL